MSEMPSPIERLPSEIKLLIFSFLQDASGLRALTLSGPALHAFVLAHEQELSSQTVWNMLLPHTVRDFALAETCSRAAYDTWSTAWSEEDVRDVLHDYRTGRHAETWLRNISSIKTALRAARLHDTMTYFIDSFVRETLPARSATDSPRPERQISRIYCALCRFEWYCWFFGNRENRPYRNDSGAMREVVWSKLAPWEHEQLVHVHEFIAQKLRGGVSIPKPRLTACASC